MKNYEVPEELRLFIDRHEAALSLRDMVIKFPFGYRKALRAATDANTFRRKFWAGINALYPELIGKTSRYNGQTQKVECEDDCD